jgi:hypothetical protein
MYRERIRLILAKLGFIGKYDPRHVEGYMRLEHSTLDQLGPRQFESEVRVAVECIDAGGKDRAERLAVSCAL